jgi:hypothetical protein
MARDQGAEQHQLDALQSTLDPKCYTSQVRCLYDNIYEL